MMTTTMMTTTRTRTRPDHDAKENSQDFDHDHHIPDSNRTGHNGMPETNLPEGITEDPVSTKKLARALVATYHGNPVKFLAE